MSKPRSTRPFHNPFAHSPEPPGAIVAVWALVLAERQGLTLLFVRKPDSKRSNELVIATENVPEIVFEPVNASAFPLEKSDLTGIGEKLCALGDDAAEEDFEKMLQSGGF